MCEPRGIRSGAAWCAFVLSVVASMLATLAIALPVWAHTVSLPDPHNPVIQRLTGTNQSSPFTFGLWVICQLPKCTPLTFQDLPNWFIAVQSLACLGFVFSIAATFTILGFLVVPKCENSFPNNQYSLFLTVLSVLCIIVGLIVFSTSASSDGILGASVRVAWCYGVEFLSALLSVLATLLLCCEGKRILVDRAPYFDIEEGELITNK